jgi:hypothetical protein
MSKTYTVRVTNEFRATTSANRLAAGLSIPTDGIGYVGPLSAEQLDELTNDPYVTVTDADGEPVEGDVQTPPAAKQVSKAKTKPVGEASEPTSTDKA